MADSSEELVCRAEFHQKQFTWRIQNFKDVIKHENTIHVQQVDFWAGKGVGSTSKWRLSLFEKTRKIGIQLQMLEIPKTDVLLSAECLFQLKSADGTLFRSKSIKIPVGSGMNRVDLTEKDSVPLPLNGDDLIICCTLKKTTLPTKQPVDELLKKFHADSTKRTWSQLRHLAEFPVDPTGVEIICSDERQFQARKEVLTVRSPVFDAMIRTNMTEKANGRVELTDISGKTMEVLLHYLYTGELLPEWRERAVITELTYAAAKYQLKQLLGFLNDAVGKVCSAENVLELFLLAGKLDLKTAENELFEFIQMDGLVSKDKFRTTLNALVEPKLFTPN